MFFIAYISTCRAETPKNIFPEGDFEGGELKTVLDHYQSNIVIRKGGVGESSNCLFIPGGGSWDCRTRQIKIEPLKKYCLSFWAKIDEENFDLSRIAFNDRAWKQTKYLPTWRVNFYSQSDKKKPLNRHHWTFYQKIISNNWREYIEIFYTPIGANNMVVVFGNGKDNYPILFDNINIYELKDRFVNINPDLSLGKYNYSGYHHAVKAFIVPKLGNTQEFMIDSRGDSIYNGYIVGDPIPVTLDKKYNITVRAKAFIVDDERKITRFSVQYYNKNMEVIKRNNITFKWTDPENFQEKSRDFFVPEGASFIRFSIGSGFFDKIQLTKK